MTAQSGSRTSEELQTLAERAPAVAQQLARLPALAGSAPDVLAASAFVLETLCRDPQAWQALHARATDRLRGSLPPPECAPGTPEAQFMTALRRWRRAEFARIAWRDLAGWSTLEETLADLSNAADDALRLAHRFAQRALIERHGRPRAADGAIQELIIVAMGKLGGQELNFSSDVDLVLLYPQSGETDGPQPIDNQAFFTRLGQTLIRLLEQPTEDGFAFRTDLRLRPFGSSGPLVSSAAALEDYLQIHGRDWERYAWVKARPVTNDAAFAELFRSAVQPFVYRRYLDFGVFESLREMKALIEREVRRRDLADNIKLGDGGIREIEFIVQSFQLIRGGQDRMLQTGSLRCALSRLAGAKLLPAAAVAELEAAYAFLRRLENRLQMRTEAQTHVLPAQPGERARIAAAMGCADWSELLESLQRHRGRVGDHFRAVVFGGARPGAGEQDATAADAAGSLNLEAELPVLAESLDAHGYAADALPAAQLLTDYQQSPGVLRLDAAGGRRLAALLPALVAAAGLARAPGTTLRRLIRVLEAIGARSAYFALLLHNVQARRRLVELATHGDFLVDQIAAHPLLLDELIDERLFEHPPDRAAMAADLEQRMSGVDPGDEERLVERLRHFQRAAVFRLAIADLLARMPVMQVSDRLTDLAELIIERALALTWQQLAPRLGVPMCGEGAQRRPVQIAVIGYGKLGGIELGYASDLDLVFVHDSSGARQETEAAAGARSIENPLYFVRFAQRLVHLLTLHSAAGRLYEVDMRLRPSGKGGMLITSVEAFAEYQRREAWTWEHQALLHARAVGGAPALRARFEQIRLEVLSRHVRRATLRADVRHMRERMRHELSRAGPGQFDLKQDPGGLADIEFLAQYWALRWAAEYPPVALFSDTIRQLESVASAALVPQEWIDALTGIYRRYRELLHHRALEAEGAVVDAGPYTSERAAVTAIWDAEMAAEGPASESRSPLP